MINFLNAKCIFRRIFGLGKHISSKKRNQMNLLKFSILLFVVSFFISISGSAQFIPSQSRFNKANRDSVIVAEVPSRQLFALEFIGAGGFASLSYTYFKNNMFYQIGLGTVPNIMLSGTSSFEDHNWLIPVQIRFHNPIACSNTSFDFGFWGRYDLKKKKYSFDNQYNAVGIVFNVKNRIQKDNWVISFGFYPYFDIQKKRFITTYGLQFAK